MICPACNSENKGEHFYCWKCGNRLGLQGWTMVNGNSSRTSFVNISDFQIKEYKFSEVSTQIPLILIGERLILFDREGNLKTFNFEDLYRGNAKPLWEIGFDAIFKICNSPVYAKSHIYFVSDGRIINVDVNSGKLIYSEIKTGEHGSLINITPTSAPLVTNDNDDVYLAFGLKGSILIIHINKYNKTTVKFEQLEDQSAVLRNPVRWQNKIVFISSEGKFFTYDLESKELSLKSIAIANTGKFSSPCVIGDTLFVECQGESGLFVIAFNLKSECSIRVLITTNVADIKNERFEFSPPGIADKGIIVSDHSTSSLKLISPEGKETTINTRNEIDCWKSLILGKNLVYAAPDGIHKLNLVTNNDSVSPMEITEKVTTPPIYFDGRLVIPLERSLILAKGSEK